MVNDPYTLVVALDEQGKALGDLYIDDGRSFAFTQGHYLHRRCGDMGIAVLKLLQRLNSREKGDVCVA
jgi:hypothetical protein